MHIISIILLALSAVQLSLSFPGSSFAHRPRGVSLHRRSSTLRRTCTDKSSSPSKKVAQTWFPGWTTSTFPPEAVSWEKYSVVTFAFVVTTPGISDLAVAEEDQATLRKLVQYGHANKTSVTVSIGGWTGSRFFSSAVATEANRTAFVNAINKIVKEYNLDGVDIDWEYPNKQGIGCNTISTEDTANFLEFLKALRASELSKDAIVTAATSIKPFMDASGNPSQSVAEFAKYLSWIEIMNYDVWGPWSPTTGPVGPLDDSCVPSTQAEGSAVSALKAWTDAGLPKNQIVLGVPAYGYGYLVNTTSAFKSGSKTELAGSYVPYVKPATTGASSVDVCGITEPASSIYDFSAIVATGLLDCSGLPNHGVPNYFDTCSQSPSIYDTKTGIWYEYDDPRSYKAKGEFIAKQGLKGFAMWDAGSDYEDLLLDAILQGQRGSSTKSNHC